MNLFCCCHICKNEKCKFIHGSVHVCGPSIGVHFIFLGEGLKLLSFVRIRAVLKVGERNLKSGEIFVFFCDEEKKNEVIGNIGERKVYCIIGGPTASGKRFRPWSRAKCACRDGSGRVSGPIS